MRTDIYAFSVNKQTKSKTKKRNERNQMITFFFYEKQFRDIKMKYYVVNAGLSVVF